MITSDIIHALQQELKYFMNGQGTYLLDTNLKDDISFNLPLIILEIKTAPESGVMLGNRLTRMEYEIILRVYTIEQGAYNDDDGGYSASLMDFLDSTRQYFCNEVWQTNEMKALTDNYGFRMEFQGVSDAEPLEGEATIHLGQRFTFASIAFDTNTNSTYDYFDANGSVVGTVNFE